MYMGWGRPNTSPGMEWATERPGEPSQTATAYRIKPDLGFGRLIGWEDFRPAESPV